MDGGKVAHLQLLGVYALKNVSWSPLPVYKHEQVTKIFSNEKCILVLPCNKISSSKCELTAHHYIQATSVEVQVAQQ